jgi:deoxyribonuclease V
MLNYNSISIEEATSLQNALRHRVLLHTAPQAITTIAGADISHNVADNSLYAGIVILSYPSLTLLSYSLVKSETLFPYVPNYLGFREVPALLEAWKQIDNKPDILILDGQGIAHPRRLGIAAHFGVLADHPTIGSAKRMLHGSHRILGEKRFSTSPIIDGSEVLGFALRTKINVKPIYISPGHKVSVEDSLHIVKSCVAKHRLPEPTRIAHETVNKFRIGLLKEGYHRLDMQGELF